MKRSKKPLARLPARPVQPGAVYVSDAQLAARYSTSRSTIWRWTKSGRLPQPLQLSPGCTRWALAEVERLDAERRAVA